MIRPDVTLSKSDLVSRCSFWMRPDVPWASTSSAASEGGTRLHRVLKTLVDGGLPEVLADPAEARMADLLIEWFNRNKRAGMRSELAVAYDVAVDTGRELADPDGESERWYTDPEKRERYGVKPTEIPGRVDLTYFGEDLDGVYVCVDDLKVHFGGGDHPDALAQLGALGLALARAHDIDRVRVRAVHLSETRVDDTSEVYWLSDFDLMAIGGELACADVRGTPEPTPGEHCKARYCPALTACPSTQAIVAQIVPAEALVRTGSLVPKTWAFAPTIESPDHLQALLAIRPVAREYMKRIDAAIDAYVADGDVVASDGTVIRQTFRSMPRLDTKELTELARAKGATEDEISACIHAKTEGAGVRATRGKKASRAA